MRCALRDKRLALERQRECRAAGLNRSGCSRDQWKCGVQLRTEDMGELASGADRDLSVIRFCSGDWPEAERRDRLRDLFGRTITRLDFEPSPQCPLDIEARFRTLPGLGFASIATYATRVRRTPV